MILIFVDGLGLGPSARHNPLSTAALPALEFLAGGQRLTADLQPIGDPDHVVRPIDANLDIDGLPQSGTGQATLFSGVNCAALAGRHYGPFPHSTSRPILEHHSLLAQLRNGLHATVAFANAYPDRFFSYVKATNRWTVTTLCCHYAGVELRGERALADGQAVPANLTGVGWPGVPFEPITEEDASRRLLNVSELHDFTFFEYFLTDKAGHGRGNVDALAVLRSLDLFIGTLAENRPVDATIVVTSDHGNVEDLSTRGHTRNPVPLIALGPAASMFAGATSLLDITPSVIAAMRGSTR